MPLPEEQATMTEAQKAIFRRDVDAQIPAGKPRAVFLDSKTVAQTLMDDLWHCGIRPTEGAGSAGALAAMQKHLDDMRALVFKTQNP